MPTEVIDIHQSYFMIQRAPLILFETPVLLW